MKIRNNDDTTKRVRYTVRFDDEDDKKINAYCERTGKSKSDLLREAVKRHIKEDV